MKPRILPTTLPDSRRFYCSSNNLSREKASFWGLNTATPRTLPIIPCHTSDHWWNRPRKRRRDVINLPRGKKLAGQKYMQAVDGWVEWKGGARCRTVSSQFVSQDSFSMVTPAPPPSFPIGVHLAEFFTDRTIKRGRRSSVKRWTRF